MTSSPFQRRTGSLWPERKKPQPIYKPNYLAFVQKKKLEKNKNVKTAVRSCLPFNENSIGQTYEPRILGRVSKRMPEAHLGQDLSLSPIFRALCLTI